MFAAMTFVLLVVTIVLHEAGHAIAMMHRGVAIKEMGIGLPLLKHVKITLHPRFLPFPLVITPFLLGAYVQASEAGEVRIKQLPYKDRVVIDSAGVIMNVVAGALLLAIACPVFYFERMGIGVNVSRLLTVSGLSLVVALVFMVCRRWISYAMPLLSVVSLVLIAVMLTTSLDSIGGPVSVYHAASSAKTSFDVLAMAASLSLGLAVINTLPLVPFDGARAVCAALTHFKLVRVERWFTVGSFAAFAAFMVFIIGKDLLGTLH